MSSSSSTSFHSVTDNTNDDTRGFPSRCHFCGCRMVIRTSGSVKNPGRLFHVCPRRDETDKRHRFKWTDESAVEEIVGLKGALKSAEEEIVGLKGKILGLEGHILGMETEMDASERVIEEMRREFNRLKLIIGGLVVFSCVYWYCS